MMTHRTRNRCDDNGLTHRSDMTSLPAKSCAPATSVCAAALAISAFPDDDSLCLDSPTFTPSALTEFEARGFERRNR